jgi:hypothetical protein
MTSKLTVVKSTPVRPKTNRTTTKAVNDALRERGRDESLRRGGSPLFLFWRRRGRPLVIFKRDGVTIVGPDREAVDSGV